MSSHMNRKYARNYRKRKSEESSHQKEFKKPKKSSAEQMSELSQHRRRNEKQETQLVYVALSRVTSIEALYLLSKRGDQRFYHGSKEDGSQISSEIKQEYTSLDEHRLPTITLQLRKFPGAAPSNNYEVNDGRVRIIVDGHNSHSLVAHSTDIATDQIMSYSDLIWINDKCNAVTILGLESLVGHSTSVNQRGGGKRTAGGVARCARSALALDIRLIESHVADICMINVTLNVELKFLLASLFAPVVAGSILGDFNINDDSDKTVLNNFMLAQFGMMPVTIPARLATPTSQGT